MPRKTSYQWDLIEEYLDVDLNLSSRNRKNSFISLRQFKEYIEDGIPIREIQKLTSKNLVAFFSKFSQGKISLNKVDFVNEYSRGKSLNTIAEENNINKDYVGFLRQLYGIKSKGPKFIFRKENEKSITPRQKSIIYGSLLGDAGSNSDSSLCFKHGITQIDYLKWKYEELANITTKSGIKEYKRFDHRSNNYHKGAYFHTSANTDVENIISNFYKNGVKEVSKEVLDNVDTLSLAVWFMDDGKTDWHYTKKINGINASPELFLCTDMFSFKSCSNIKEYMNDKFNIKSKIRKMGPRKDGEEKYRIKIDYNENERFFSLIKDYVFISMRYKICFDEYVKWRDSRQVNRIYRKKEA